MGQEIEHSHFRKQDFTGFENRLQEETRQLGDYFARHLFAEAPAVAGFELEAWLIDDHGRALPRNEDFLEGVDSSLICPELARFNVEFNGRPQRLEDQAIRKMHHELTRTWAHAQGHASRTINGELLAIGILPCLKESELNLKNMSAMTRYRALNEQVRRMRQGEPMKLDIKGREGALMTWQEDVMLESAATSFQIHLQVNQHSAARTYNAAMILSGPMVAMSANSPYLFGHDLWDETRIPVFEQAVSVCSTEQCLEARVTFGDAYLKESLEECFLENLKRYPVLLPESLEQESSPFAHLRLHNGTIWRWNRPLIGFDNQGRPHLRIEHRVMAAGPSLIDVMANAAFFYGLINRLVEQSPAPEKQLPFAKAKNNFYAAARDGLMARQHWLNGKVVDMSELLTEELLPMSREGLTILNIDKEDIEIYLGVIEARVRSGQNGAVWQRRFVNKYGRDMEALTLAYRDRQRSGKAVFEWDC